MLDAAASSAATVRTDLGLDPPTLAAQARAVARTRRGPVALTGCTDANYVAPLVDPAGAAQPSVVRGSSGVLVVYSSQVGGYVNSHLAASHPGAGGRGWALTVTGAHLYAISIGDGGFATFTGAVATVGWHAVAWSISAGGATRWSLDGAAIVPDGTTPSFAARSGDPVRIGRGVYDAVPATIPLAYLALWATVLSDLDLIALATTPGAGAPTLPSAPAWEWAAAAHVGCARVSVGADVYATVGAPALWMP